MLGRAEAEHRFAEVDRRLAELAAATDAHAADLSARSVDAIAPTMAWIERATLGATPLISVVMPTHNRADRLRRAVDSVLAQTYERFELVIADDGSDDGGATAAALEAIDDPRLRTLALGHVGASVARNSCLESARGDLIAYLDDDNLMHPQWLKSVAWAFEQRPDTDVLYGALVIDDHARAREATGGELPTLHFRRFDRSALAEWNLADMSALAHRAGLAGAWFEPGLIQMADWDLLVRLTADREPLALPAIAAFYLTDAPDRLSGGPTEYIDAELVRRRARAAANGGVAASALTGPEGPLLRLIADPERPLELGGWALSAAALERVLGLVPPAGGQVVECGSGESTVAIARLLRFRGAGHLFALEHHGGWAGELRARLAAEGLEAWATVIDAPLRPHPLAPPGSEWYDEAVLSALPDRIDLLLVDGPPATEKGHGRDRYPALGALGGRLAAGAAVVIDDVDRAGERWILERWQAETPITFERVSPELAIGTRPRAEPELRKAQESRETVNEFQRGD